MKPIQLFVSLAIAALLASATAAAPQKPVTVMIIGGQNNHDWAKSTPYIKRLLDEAGHFQTTLNNTPPQGASPEAWQAWQPQFAGHDCVVLDYNGQMWPDEIKKRFVQYIAEGGGALLIHAANNAFTGWKEYEQMAGLLWRGRDYGYSLYLDEQGTLVRENPGEGRGMGHGGQYDWIMTTRDPKHPITSGMPPRWMHKHDELYHGQRGPAENIRILLTAYSDPAPGRGGTGKHEPILWWVPYGKGKVVVNLMGHVGQMDCLQCVGFQTILKRSCEWLAFGRCTTPLPADFPTAEKVSLRP